MPTPAAPLRLDPPNPAQPPPVAVAEPSPNADPQRAPRSGMARLDALLRTAPRNLVQSDRPPPRSFLDQIVRLNLDSNEDGYTRSLLDSVATAARTTLAPIFLTMERIITDQDQLVASLRRQLVEAEAAASAAAAAPLPVLRPPVSDAAVNTDPPTPMTNLASPGGGPPADGAKEHRKGPVGSRKGDRMAQPKFLSRRAKQTAVLKAALPDSIPALVLRPVRRPSPTPRDPVRYAPVYFRVSIAHPDARKHPLHWLRASLAAMKAPYAPELSPIGRGLRTWEAWVAEERVAAFTQFLSDHSDLFEHLPDFDVLSLPISADADEDARRKAHNRAADAFLRRRSRLARNAFPMDLRRCIVEAFPACFHDRLEPGLARLLPNPADNPK
ncbi:hypothetical protein DFJ73DRAFT_870885 [Zopfochytrium polystomum]|nr:hypothetical protein DFJ73DRAFT_870885 [Zopfochytrium polystomum]